MHRRWSLFLSGWRRRNQYFSFFKLQAIINHCTYICIFKRKKTILGGAQNLNFTLTLWHAILYTYYMVYPGELKKSHVFKLYSIMLYLWTYWNNSTRLFISRKLFFSNFASQERGGWLIIIKKTRLFLTNTYMQDADILGDL